MENRKKLLIFFSVLLIIIFTASYIYYSDHSQLADLPDNIIPVEQELVTAYLIKIPNGYLLFDTGYEKDFNNFKNILAKKNISAGSIRYILLSHHHDDHSGFITQLTQANPAVKIIIHEKGVDLLASGKNNKSNGGGIINPLIYSLFRIKQIITPDWTLTFPPFRIGPRDIIIHNELSPLPLETGIEGTIIFTPGHSTDSISLLLNGKYLLCGDLASNFLNWAGAGNLTLFNEDVAEVYKSWEKVISMKVQYIIPAHGKTFSIEKLKENLNKYSQKDLVRFF